MLVDTHKKLLLFIWLVQAFDQSALPMLPARKKKPTTSGDESTVSQCYFKLEIC